MVPIQGLPEGHGVLFRIFGYFDPKLVSFQLPTCTGLMYLQSNFYWYVYTNILTRSYPSLFKAVIQVGYGDDNDVDSKDDEDKDDGEDEDDNV